MCGKMSPPCPETAGTSISRLMEDMALGVLRDSGFTLLSMGQLRDPSPLSLHNTIVTLSLSENRARVGDWSPLGHYFRFDNPAYQYFVFTVFLYPWGKSSKLTPYINFFVGFQRHVWVLFYAYKTKNQTKYQHFKDIALS